MKGTNRSPKWRKLLIAATLAAVVVLGLAVTLALAQQELPGAVNAFIQTSGPNTWLAIGDWYTNNNTTAPPGAGPGANSPHRFAIFVPCNIPPTSVLTVELFDPELWPGTVSIDEIRDAGHNITTNTAFADDSTFELLAPDGSQVAIATYTPTAATSDQWVVFATFTRGAFNCAPGEASVVYELRVSTSDNDDNSWRLRVSHPDNIPGTGDEPWPVTINTSFQHGGTPGTLTCQDFYWYVNPAATSVQVNNFDLDVPGYTPNATLTYFLPDGTSVSGTTSDNAVWNNGTSTARGGDVFTNPPAGWWRAEVCVAPDNQYIFEPPNLTVPPPVPDPALSHGTAACRVPGQSQVIQYTIDFGNTSTDAAAFLPNLTFTLPTGTTFESCSGGLSCGETSPGSGVVTFLFDPVLPAGGAEQVLVNVRLGAGAPDSLSLTSTAELDYVDVFNNDYDPFVDTLTAEILPCAQGDLRISKASDISCYETDESQIVNYTINYGNQGTTPAVDATVTDTLPGATTFVSCSGGLSCAEQPPGSGVVVYSLGTLDPGATGSVRLTARVDADASGSLTNRARIEAVQLPAAEAIDVLRPCTAPPPPSPPGIPEPTTLALVGLGLAGLAGYARRRRQRQVD